MKTQSAALTTGLVIIALGVSACGTNDDKNSDHDYSVLSAFSEIPADDLFSEPIEQRIINTGDLRKATEIAGLTRPDDLESAEFASWIGSITGTPDTSSPIFVPIADALGLRTLELETQVDDEVGWSLLDIDQYVEQSSGVQVFAVVQGKLSRSSRAYDQTSDHCSSLPIAATVIQSGRSWEDWLATQRPTGDDPALLDDLASQLPNDGGPVLGVGWSVSDDGEPVTTIAYYLGTDEAAEAALPILESHYNGDQSATAEITDFVTLTEVRSDGPVAIVKVSPAEGQQAGIVGIILTQHRAILPFT